MECELELPVPPSVNVYKKIGRLVKTKRGKMYQQRVNSPETIAFYYQVYMRIKAQGAKSFAGATISVEVQYFPASKRKSLDVDNLAKVLLDSMQHGGLYDDDKQIARLLIERKGIIPHGKVIVRIKELQCT